MLSSDDARILGGEGGVSIHKLSELAEEEGEGDSISGKLEVESSCTASGSAGGTGSSSRMSASTQSAGGLTANGTCLHLIMMTPPRSAIRQLDDI